MAIKIRLKISRYHIQISKNNHGSPISPYPFVQVEKLKEAQKGTSTSAISFLWKGMPVLIYHSKETVNYFNIPTKLGK